MNASKKAIMLRTANVRAYLKKVCNDNYVRIYTDKLDDGRRSVKVFGGGLVFRSQAEAIDAAKNAANETGAVWRAYKRGGHYDYSDSYTIRAYV